MNRSMARQKDGNGVLDSISINSQEEPIMTDDYNIPYDAIVEDANLSQSSIEVKPKRSTVSIDVTKALLLLGFASWSVLEPGKIIDFKCCNMVSLFLAQITCDTLR